MRPPETPTCAEASRLGRVASSSTDAALLAHIQSCEICSAEWSSLRRLTALAGALPAPGARAARRDVVRARLVASAASLPPARHRLARRLGTVAAVVAAAAGAMGALALSNRRPVNDGATAQKAAPLPVPAPAPAKQPPPAASLHRGTVEAKGRAHYTWSPLPDEMVRLSEGRISVQVAPLGRGERFRVVAGDAEVEVRGTAFDVSVAGDQLVAVKVAHGVVTVRPAQGPAVFLGRGEEWRAPTAEEPPAARPAHVAQAAHPGPGERAFAQGWRALRSGGYADAAGAFERAAEAGPGAALAEDARYWRAVALARAGHAAEARAAMSVFLELHPESTRAGEISAMLGWLLLDIHDDKGAARHFAAAASDPGAAVRSSARAGLSAVARRAHSE